ncbi:MAG: hypothetical protein WAX04_10940 [Oscillospiraceae bacterium]
MVKKEVPILLSKDSSTPNLLVMGVSGKGMCFNNKINILNQEKSSLEILKRKAFKVDFVGYLQEVNSNEESTPINGIIVYENVFENFDGGFGEYDYVNYKGYTTRNVLDISKYNDNDLKTYLTGFVSFK